MICFFIKAISYLVFAAQGKSVLQTIVFSLKHYTENRYVKNIPGEYSYTNVTGAWCPEERQTSAIFSSPELKAQVSFSDHLSSGVCLSVRPAVRTSVCLSVCL